ncbi:helix-turn-helix domain-containing protein [Halomarina litorea]|uniref:helix-turn-helix domain-containing protein n=1 Tax=Halomarina litorea TaxID=2961595 RepID=UPI0020C52A05|nr:helix-turn-helix domain-containing protein [Halomarina sp. BCD28]
MEQYDCPFIAASDAHDVAFSAAHWEFDRTADRLETRMVVEGPDREGWADIALSELDRDNGVVSRERVELAELQGFVQNVGAAMTLIEGCRDLSDRERETLEAVDAGYFDSPRGATLDTLADRFEVSKPAVSKTLRRGQAKTISRVTEVLESLDEEERDGCDG